MAADGRLFTRRTLTKAALTAAACVPLARLSLGGEFAGMPPLDPQVKPHSGEPMSSKRIDVHAHFVPDFYRRALVEAGRTKPDGMPGIPQWSEEDALRMMDKLQIQAAVLSVSSPGVHFHDDLAAKELARRLNEEGTRLRHAHPGRFGLFAVTPLPNVDLAIEEAVYAIEQLQAEGVVVESNHDGLYQGDSKLDPFYAELNSRKAAMFIHPTSPSCQGCEALSLGYPRPMLEFMFETTRTVTNLILQGVTTRFPDIRIIIPHAGAALPVLASRVDGLTSFILGASGKPVPQMKTEMRKLYYDMAGALLPELLEALLRIADPEHLFYGSDWPFTPLPAVAGAADSLDATPLLNGPLRAAVMTANALKLFGSLTGKDSESAVRSRR
jgi:predicted TIM-barrel fold metal-dependent hydrolase